MISHEYRCIFIHIPRCAGTSVERWIAGRDWWAVDLRTKHLTASQAKALYAGVWDRYFKFSIVREPVSRTISCLKFASHFGLSYARESGIDFRGYHARFGEETVVEHDHRFFRRDEVATGVHRPGMVYGNILDETIDLVCRFETLERDMERVRKAIGKRDSMSAHAEKFDKKPIAETDLSPGDIGHIHWMYRHDIKAFGYGGYGPTAGNALR